MNSRGAATSGWTALLLGAVFMGSAGLALAIVPRWILRFYTADAAIISTGVTLLRQDIAPTEPQLGPGRLRVGTWHGG